MPAVKRHQHQRSLRMFKCKTNAKGQPMRRIIAVAKIGNREYTLHATKGYRSRRR